MIRCILITALLLCAGLSFSIEPLPIVPFIPDVYVVHNSGMVPLELFCPIIKATAEQDLKTSIITITKGENKLICKQGSLKALQNGQAIALTVEPQEINGMLYCPLEPLVKAFGGSVTITNGGKGVQVSLPVYMDNFVLTWD